MRYRIGVFILLIALCCIISGCVTTGDRLLNDQNIKAGEFIAITSTLPEVQQAGKDVAENSRALTKALGVAAEDEQLDYSAETSAALRAQAEIEHENVTNVIDSVQEIARKNLPDWMLAVVGWLAALGAGLKGFLVNKKKSDQVVALVTGAQKVRTTIAESFADKKMTAAELDNMITAILEAKQAAYNVAPEIKELIARLKESGKLDSV